MVFHMKAKTTLSIDPALMREVKAEAARRGITMSELVESALRELLEQHAEPCEPPPLPGWHLGPFRVNVADPEELYELLKDD
jgi:hypothetical protein